MHVVAVVAAGGQGRRLGTPIPKQFLELGGQTLLERSVRALAACARVQEIIVALPAERVSDPPSYLLDVRITVVEGGTRRQDSVANAVHAAPPEADIVLIHDAARPFVDVETIDRVIDGAMEAGAAIAALQARDTVKLANVVETSWVGTEFGEPLPAVRLKSVPAVKRTLDRETIYLAQTPQGFRRDVLNRVLELGAQGAEGTDEAALAEQAGCTVLLVDGDSRNIKITTAVDLAFARGLLLERGEVV
jgi:2-C-methyl-D-erythritol 4-phosphate cytidylyltransferase / 2-C-methyl-D-erythritol 2,4-cyclodiphosphate synthase